MRRVLCWFGWHVTPRGWNPDFSSGVECACCHDFVPGALR